MIITLRDAAPSRGQVRKSPFDSRLSRLQRAPGLGIGVSAELILAGWAKGVTDAPGAPRERAAERLIHPRTVDRGGCKRRLIVRAPTPEADAVNAAPITSTRSSRRRRVRSGSTTCVRRHSRQRARRGRSRR